MRELFTTRDARLYLTGQTLSSTGDTVMWLAMGIWVKTLTGSNGAAGLVFFCFAGPQLLAPLGGMLVDRLPRRRVLLATNLASAVLLTTLIAVRGPGQVWLIHVVMAGYGAAYTVLSAGQTALLKDIVDERLLGDANSYLRTVQEGSRLFGPLLGAALFTAWGGATVALLDAATFAAAAWTLFCIHAPTPPGATTASWHHDFTAGFRYIAATAPLRELFTACAIVFSVVGVLEPACFAVVAGLHRPPTFLAVIIVAQGAGAITTGITAAAVMRHTGETRLTALGLALFTAGVTGLTTTRLALVLAGSVILGASLPWIYIGPTTLIQRLTPSPLIGRVTAAADVLLGTPQTISIAVGAALIELVDYRLLLAAIATLTGTVAAYLFTRPPDPATPATARPGTTHQTNQNPPST